jgi:hypothetical protein
MFTHLCLLIYKNLCLIIKQVNSPSVAKTIYFSYWEMNYLGRKYMWAYINKKLIDVSTFFLKQNKMLLKFLLYFIS